MVERIAGWMLLAAGFVVPAAAQSTGPEDTARVIRQNPLANLRLRESSGLAASRRSPGLLWTINDSGNPAELFATDSSGRDLGVFRVRHAENRDWEALALARCGAADCLYIAETGDNRNRHRTAKIYRVAEPAVDSGSQIIDLNGVVELYYEDGPRNVEALLVTSDQEIYLISKERSGGGRLYHVGASAWRSRTPVRARLVQELTLPEGLGYQITDASLNVDGVRVAIRSYRYILFFTLLQGKLLPDSTRHRCDAGGLDAQGEGLTWLSDGRLATTSERVMMLGGTISFVECR